MTRLSPHVLEATIGSAGYAVVEQVAKAAGLPDGVLSRRPDVRLTSNAASHIPYTRTEFCCQLLSAFRVAWGDHGTPLDKLTTGGHNQAARSTHSWRDLAGQLTQGHIS
jgi:hypothetical protein